MFERQCDSATYSGRSTAAKPLRRLRSHRRRVYDKPSLQVNEPTERLDYGAVIPLRPSLADRLEGLPSRQLSRVVRVESCT